MSHRRERRIRLRDDDEQLTKPEGTYVIEAICTNCLWEGPVNVPKGTAVPWGSALDALARCEHCGCHTLQRTEAPEEDEQQGATDPAAYERNLREFERIIDEERRRRPLPGPDPTPSAPYTAPRPHHPRAIWFLPSYSGSTSGTYSSAPSSTGGGANSSSEGPATPESIDAARLKEEIARATVWMLDETVNEAASEPKDMRGV